MNPLLSLMLLAAPKPAVIIDAAISAHAAQTKGNAAVTRIQSTSKSRSTATLSVSWIRPYRALVRFGDGRTVYLNGTSLVAYEPGPNEWLQRVSSKGASAGDRISASLGQLEYVAHILLDKDEMRSFLAPMKNSRWNVTETKKLLRLSTPSKKGKSSVSFTFDKATKLLVEGSFSTAQGNEKWSIGYRKPAPTIGYKPPKGASFVRYFASSIELPSFASKAAEETVRRVVKAYRGYSKGVVVATTDEGSVRMVFDGNRLKQTDAIAKWSYDGKTLTFTRNGKTARFNVVRSDLIDKVAALGDPMDAFLRSLSVRQIPYQNLLVKEAQAAVGGQVNVAGQPCTILNLRRPGSRAALFVRRDGLIQSVSVESLDAEGNVLSSSSRRFTYGPLSPGESFK